MFGSLASGDSEISHLLLCGDVIATINCFRQMGVEFQEKGDGVLVVRGLGPRGLQAPQRDLDCGNSATTMRLLMGILSGQSFSAHLVGDESLQRRPMRRVADSLRNMGAEIELTEGEHAPLTVRGRKLRAVDCELRIASAQVKSAILLAGLFAQGRTTVRGTTGSRDHTERMLPCFGIPVEIQGDSVTVQGVCELQGAQVVVPGDPSSAAFWAAAACLVPGGSVELEGVSLNPTRFGFYCTLKRMGARVETEVVRASPEPVGRISVEYGSLRGVDVRAEDVPFLIDELPLVAVLATQASGVTEVRGAEELRVKETDRILAMESNLRKLGAEVTSLPDGFRICGPQTLRGANLDSWGDHRVAMASAIAALIADRPTTINGAECVGSSYTEFYNTLSDLST